METDSPPPEPSAPRRGSSAWSKVFRLFLVLILAGMAGWFSFIWLAKQGIDSTREGVVEIVKSFQPEKVVETFEEWKELTAKGTEGNILEVATAESTEIFKRQTNIEMFGRSLPLGTTVSEIEVPATFRFHIDLNDSWFVTSDGSRMLVLAPEIRPSLPVAFDTRGMRKKTKSGWARWDADENLDELEKSITSRLEVRARSEEIKDEIREESRKAVALFVQKWLLREAAWGEGRFEEISVRFPGEEEASLSGMTPTIRIEGDREAEEVLP